MYVFVAHPFPDTLRKLEILNSEINGWPSTGPGRGVRMSATCRGCIWVNPKMRKLLKLGLAFPAGPVSLHVLAMVVSHTQTRIDDHCNQYESEN